MGIFIYDNPGSEPRRIIFSDLKKSTNVYYNEKIFNIKDPILNLFNRIHFSGQIDNFINLPFKSIWNKYYSLNKYSIKSKEITYLLFNNFNLQYYTQSFLKDRSECGFKLILIMLDPMSTLDKRAKSKILLFDLIISFDKNDADKFGFLYTPGIYSKTEYEVTSLKQDIFYIGRAKNRLKILHDLFDKFSKAGYTACFYIFGVNKKEQQYLDIVYNTTLPYSTVIKKVIESRCLVEVLNCDQSGTTLRALEAICYNKMLITNNIGLKNWKYYDARFMQIFENIEDLDISKVLNTSEIDYHYNNDYSPSQLLPVIEKVING